MGKVFRRFDEYHRTAKRIKSDSGSSIAIPDFIDWLRWRLVIEKIATLQEINTHYDILDVLDANILLNLKDEAEQRAMV